jgi:WD40 repeat protein
VARLGTIAFRHGRVSFGDSLTFTPDGKHLVSAGGGWVRRWDVATGKATVTLGDGKNRTHMVTADGTRARIGTADGTAEYDLDTGKELQTCSHFDFPKTDAAYWFPHYLSPDGKMFADFNSNGEFTLWNAGAGIVLHHFKPSARPYTAFAFAPDGTTVLVGDDAHTFRVFDLTTAKELRSFGIDNAKAVAGMKISPDGKWLVSVGGKRQENDLNNGVWPDDHFLRLWDLEKGTAARTIDFPEGSQTESLLFTPDSRTLIAGGRPGAVRTWDVATGKPGRAWTDDHSLGSILAVSPDGKTLATLAECGVIRLWDMQTGKEKRPLDATPCPVMDVCWTDAKTIMTIGRDDHTLRDWEAATGKPLGSPRALQKPGDVQTISPGGKLLVAIEFVDKDSQVIRLYDPANDKLVLEQPGYRAAVSPNGKRLAIGGVDEPIRFIDIDTGKRIQTVTLDAEDPNAKYLDSLADLFVFTSDGRTLIVQGKDKISTWDVRTGDQKSAWSILEKELLKPPVETGRTSWERIEGVAASPDGNAIAFSLLKDGPLDKRGNVTNPFNRIAILETTTGKLLHQIDVDKEFFEHVAFSPDGKLLAAGGHRTVRLWDLATGKETGNFEGHFPGFMSITSLAFSPDGKRLASASYDSTVLVWDVAK